MNKRWFRLDTAGLIFPAIRNRKWSNCFRMSMTLNETIDPDILQKAVNDLQPRFPSFYVSLKKGFFWYYLDQIKDNVIVEEDYAYPLTLMTEKELSKCCLRVLYFENRIAVEYFHSLTDGTGGSIFISTLVSHYLQLKENAQIKPQGTVLDINSPFTEEEIEDDFHKYAKDYKASMLEKKSYKIRGTYTNYNTLVTGVCDTEKLKQVAHQNNSTVTVFLASVMIQSLMEKQASEKLKKHSRIVKATIPINLRKFFKSSTLRNFVLAPSVGVNPKYGDYSLEEISTIVDSQLKIYTTKNNMLANITHNVLPQNNIFLKLAPRFIKDIVLNTVYFFVGEISSITVSNLGVLDTSEEMKKYISRFEFIVGVQKSYPNNCAIASYNGITCINIIRNIKESELERIFFSKLVELGVPISIECNTRR